jgi:hypothetical protein
MTTSVKVLAPLLVAVARAEKPVWKPFQGFRDHIKGVIPADIMPFQSTGGTGGGFAPIDPLFAGYFCLNEQERVAGTVS